MVAMQRGRDAWDEEYVNENSFFSRRTSLTDFCTGLD